MALAESIDRVSKLHRNRTRQCAAIRITTSSKLTESDVTAYLETLQNIDTLHPEYLPATRLVGALKAEGFQMSNSSIERHRRQECACFSSGV
jgi:hypothetical protein